MPASHKWTNTTDAFTSEYHKDEMIYLNMSSLAEMARSSGGRRLIGRFSPPNWKGCCLKKKYLILL